MPCSILTLSMGAGVGPLPILVDENGQVNRDVLAWFVMEKRDGLKAMRTLRGYGTALCRFSDYWKFHEAQKIEKPVFSAFFEALVHGQPEIGWRDGVSTDVAGDYVMVLGLFLDWLTEQTGEEHPNPKVEQPVSWGERLNQYRRRFKNDLLFHLHNATKGSRIKIARRINPARRARRGGSSGSTRPKKTFSLDDYLLLIKHEKDPRSLLMWLLLGAGGFRVSEPLHLFVTDVLLDAASGEARFVFADPTYGRISIPDESGAMTKLTRQEYLKRFFNRVPRDQLPDNHIHWAGWKGMKWHDTEAKTSDVVWLHPYFGQLFWKTHQEYLSLRGQTQPQHPWYFVNFKANTGEPLSISNISAIFGAACARLNIQSPHNPHSLRHLYVYTLINVYGLSLHQAQILVRHVSPESTEIYAQAALETTRRALVGLAKKMIDLPGAEQWIDPPHLIK